MTSSEPRVESPIHRPEVPEQVTPSKPEIRPAAAAGVAAARTAKPDLPAVRQAVAEVREIVESLEQALEQMEEVLRLVEHAERQKAADEHEIDSLRRALHKIQAPRETRRAQGG